jgi:hypothetical protein
MHVVHQYSKLWRLSGKYYGNFISCTWLIRKLLRLELSKYLRTNLVPPQVVETVSPSPDLHWWY